MVATISPTTLADLRRKGEKVTLIDVRTPAEYGEVHVDFAHNIPLDRLDAKSVTSLAGSGPVYFVCKSGTRSQKACEKLLAAGLTDVISVEGGTAACEAAGVPVVRGRKVMSLERQVRAQKAKELGKAADAADVAVDAAEYPKYLAAAYRAADFPKPRNVIGFVKDLPVPEMETLLLTHASATDEDLRRLANERAQGVKSWLVEGGGIAPERVFLTAPQMSGDGIKDKGRASRVDFSLK